MKDIDHYSVTSREGEYGLLYMADLLEEAALSDGSLEKITEEIEEYPREERIIIRGEKSFGDKAEGNTELRRIKYTRKLTEHVPEHLYRAIGDVLRKEE